MRFLPAVLAITLLLPLAAGASAQDSTAVKQGNPATFSFQQKVTVPVDPALAYDLATGDISGWWDHKFSEQPAQFCIEPRAGGGFWELFDTAGNGVRHAEVIWAERGKRLRFEGPLGLAGSAIQVVYTYDFASRADGTELTLTVNAAGQMEESWGATVAQVWHHFLARYRDYVVTFKSSGRSDDRRKTCGPRLD